MSTLDLTAAAHLQRRPTSRGALTRLDQFFARFNHLDQGLTVQATETSTDVWTITTFPGTATQQADANNEYADQVFFGGRTYTVTGSLATALSTEGYNVT